MGACGNGRSPGRCAAPSQDEPGQPHALCGSACDEFGSAQAQQVWQQAGPAGRRVGVIYGSSPASTQSSRAGRRACAASVMMDARMPPVKA